MTFKTYWVMAALLLLGCDEGLLWLFEQREAPLPPPRAAGTVALDYQKRELANGLRLILHEDHTDPLVHVDVTYDAGAARAQPGLSGLPRLAEHLVNASTQHLRAAQREQLLTETGAQWNGVVESDGAHYWTTLPAGALERVLWLESERMGFVAPQLSAAELESRRQRVQAERARNLAEPYAAAFQALYAGLYGASHPYAAPVWGWPEDLAQITLADVQQFVTRHYAPNHAVLSIGGDIDPARVEALVRRYFEPIPRAPELPPLTASAGPERDRHLTLESDAPLPALLFAVSTVAEGAPAEPALDAAVDALNQPGSPLYAQLVDSGLALGVSALHPCRRLSCELIVFALLNPASGAGLAELEAGIRRALAQVADGGVDAAQLERFGASYEHARVFGLQAVAERVKALSFFETERGEPTGLAEQIAGYTTLRSEDVVQALRRHVLDAPALVLSAVPTGRPQLAAHADDVGPRSPVAAVRLPTLPLAQTPETFDRSVPPTLQRTPLGRLAPYRERLDSGDPLLGVRERATQTTTLELLFAAGSRDEGPQQAGLAALTGALLRARGPAFEAKLQRMAASLEVRVEVELTRVRLAVLSRQLPAALPLLAELLSPIATDAARFEALRAQQLAELQAQLTDTASRADRAAAVALYGASHPLARASAGDAQLTLQDAQTFARDVLAQRRLGVLVVSDLSPHALAGIAAVLGALPPPMAADARPALPPFAALPADRLYLADVPGAATVSLRIVTSTAPLSACGDFQRLRLASAPFGLLPPTRLSQRLPVEASGSVLASDVVGARGRGLFAVVGELPQAAAVPVLTRSLEALRELAAEGMRQDEHAALALRFGAREALQHALPADKLRLLEPVLTAGFALDYRQLQAAQLGALDRDALSSALAQQLDPGALRVVLSGDAASLRPQLEAQGLRVELLP